MKTGKPSRTALGAAKHRANHQVLEGGRIFSDPLAIRILGSEAEVALRDARANPAHRAMRLFIAARTRFAEDALAVALTRGARQLVVLGAGLDTYAYRAPREGVRIFEVDHPDTQAWKRACLAAAAITVPNDLTFAPIDFDRGTLEEGLEKAGFDRMQHTFFMWLGVTVYLSKDVVWSTLQWISALANGVHVVFDYGEPAYSRPEAEHARLAERVSIAANLGEPWIGFFEPREMHAKLRAFGFRDIEDLGSREVVARYSGVPTDGRRGSGAHVLHASTS